jgi:hypothetical protein
MALDEQRLNNMLLAWHEAQSQGRDLPATELGREADIFKAVVWHSIILACIVGPLCLLQAYVWPFTAMVP